MAYNINIVNGKGTSNVMNGQYSVTSNTTGYDNTSILPTMADIVEGTNEYNFTVAATGILTLHVTEDGTSTGTAVVGAKFIRTDSSGNTYGTEVTSDASGNAIFENVPFASSGAPLIYYKQTASDGLHKFDDAVKNTSLTASTGTVEVLNELPTLRTFNYTDANYNGLPVNGEIILN